METMRERFAATAVGLLETDPRVAVVLADISVDYFQPARRRHPDRVINVGIREQLLVSVAGGLALEGLRPIVHTIAPFLVERPYEQLKLDLGHQGVGAVLVSGGASYDYSTAGRTHHSPGDVAALDALTGWTVHVPGHPAELEPLLLDAAAGDGRVYVRLSERSNSSARPIRRGRLDVVRRGQRATVVAVGPMLDATLAAVDGLDVTVLYAATVRPFDAGTLRSTLGTPDVVLVEPYLAGTSAAAVSAALTDVPHRLLALGVTGEEVRRYGTPAEHDALHGLDARGIRRSIDGFLRQSPRTDTATRR
jgi:transketolase